MLSGMSKHNHLVGLLAGCDLSSLMTFCVQFVLQNIFIRNCYMHLANEVNSSFLVQSIDPEVYLAQSN